MADPQERDAPSSSLATVVTLALAIAALYLAKQILLPLALAVLLSFILTPLVKLLERAKLGRIASVMIVVAVAFSGMGGLGWLATNQIVELSNELPEYKGNLLTKIRSVRGSGEKLKEAKEALEDISDELTNEGDVPEATAETAMPVASDQAAADRRDARRNEKDAAVAVKVVELPPSPLTQIQTWLGPLVAPLSTAGIVIMLVIFMLIKREDLRDRMIQVVGTSSLHATTEAIDDASGRLSRYLRMTMLINAIYGLVVALGLWSIGIPNALLAGVFGTLLRFLPYVGPWIAALMPITLSLAISDGWTQPLMTIGLFVFLELVVNNGLEPWLYGSSVGVSSLGVILAAITWTWLWGPIGLVLAVPLTACLIVLGKYIPQLAFLEVLLGERSPLEPHERLYQRLLTAHDLEASELADQYLKSATVAELYEEVLVPALHLAEQDRHRGLLSDQQEREVIESARELIDDLADRADPADPSSDALAEADAPAMAPSKVLCVPVRDQADETVAMLLGQLLARLGFVAEVTPLEWLASETVDRTADRQFDVIVLSVLPPLGSRNARYLCKRLRQREPEARIVVALLNGKTLKKTRQRLLDSGANEVATSIPETLLAVRRHSSPVGRRRDAAPDVAADDAAIVVPH